MDRTVFLTQFFLPRGSRIPSFRSFTAHRRFFLENDQFEDREYSQYIRENTGWYETMSRPYRDNFIVRDATYTPQGLTSRPGEPPRFTRVPAVRLEAERAWSSILGLRNKYLRTLPGLDKVSINVHELTDYFEGHASQLQPGDMTILNTVRKSFGSNMPDLLELATHIQQYLNFVGNHFHS